MYPSSLLNSDWLIYKPIETYH